MIEELVFKGYLRNLSALITIRDEEFAIIKIGSDINLPCENETYLLVPSRYSDSTIAKRTESAS